MEKNMDRKIDDSRFEIENVVPEKVEIVEYHYNSLLERKTVLEKELADIDDLINRAEAVGFKKMV